jgi:hypothetical protein
VEGRNKWVTLIQNASHEMSRKWQLWKNQIYYAD